MPIPVSCPDCGRDYNMADHLLGKTVRCKGCGSTFPVIRAASAGVRKAADPAAPTRQMERDEEFDDDDRPRRRTDVEAGSKKWFLIGGGALAAIAAAAVAIIVANNNSDDDSGDGEPKNTDGIAQGPRPSDVQKPGDAPKPPQPGPELQGKVTDKPPGPPDKPPDKPKPPEPPPLVAWTARPDPMPEPITAPTRQTILPLANFTHFLFPTTPSAFVFVHEGRTGNNAYRVVDLRTAQPICSGTLNVSLHRAALSPDGKYLATLHGKVDRDDGLRFYSLADGSELSAVGVRAPEHSFSLDFVGQEHVLTITGEDCHVWNIKTGKGAAQYTIDERHFANARSPGRKYHACYSPKKHLLQVREAMTGKVVGELRMPEGDKDGAVEPRNLAFSPDGEEIACIARWGVNEKRYRLLTWKMSNGEPATDLGLGSTGPNHFLAHAHDQAALQWFPDRSGWLIAGRAWLDAESGEQVFEAQPRYSMHAHLHRLIGKEHMTVVIERKGRPGESNKEFRVVALPLQEIAAGIAKARKPELALPATKAADLAAAKTLQADGAEVPLALMVDPPPTTAANLGPAPIRLPAATENVADILFTGADVGQVVILSAVPVNEISVTRKVRADKLDLATGALIGGVDLFAGRRLEPPKQGDNLEQPPIGGIGPVTGALSPDGERLMAKQAGKPGRLDLWDLKARKHLTGWLPCGDEKTSVEWFAFLDASRVLTVGGNKLTLWKMPECQAVYVVDGVPSGAALSPGRKYVAFSTKKQLVVLDSASGECKGRLTPPGGELRPSHAPVFRFDGAQIAAGYAQAGATKFGRWDVRNGTLLASLDCGLDHPPFFAGNHNLLIGKNLYQWNLDRPLCEYSFQEVYLLSRGSPDQRIWWLRTGPYGAELVGQSPIHPKLTGLTASIAGREVDKVPKPGEPLQVSITGNAIHSAQITKEGAERRLRTLRYNVGAGGLTLRLHLQSYDTGKFMSYDLVNIGTGQKSGQALPVLLADCQVALVDAGGATLYQNKYTVGPPTSFSTTGDALGALHNSLRADVLTWVQSRLELPENLYRIGGRPVLLPVQLGMSMGR